MIRVDLLDRQRRWSWSKALLLILVVCGGLYGIHQFSPALVRPLFNTGSDLISKAQQEFTPKPTPSPTVQQESTPEPTAQQETTPSPVQESTPEPTAQQESTPSPVQESTPSPVQESAPEPTAQQESTPEPTAQQEKPTPSPAVQQESTPEPTAQQESTPSPVQESTPEPTAQQEKPTPSPTVQQETTPEPTAQQETTPSSVVQRETTPQRSTACHQVMRINEKVPAEIRVSSLNCNSSGEYWLEGTSPSHKVLRMFRLSLQALPSRISFSTWREERTLRFSFQGRFVDQDAPPLAPLSSSQAEQFLGKVARWAEASGLDSLSIHKPIHRPLSPTRAHQRQKLRGLGSPQQIDAFLQQLQQAEEVATLGEVLLLPIKSDENGWVQARLYAAVDIIVDGP